MFLEQAREIHRRAIVVDLHCDTPQRLLDAHLNLGQRHVDGHLDIPRMKEGGLTAEFFAAWVQPHFAPHYLSRAIALLDSVHRMVEANAADIGLATSAADIRRLHAEGKLAALLCVEGGHSMEDNLGVLNTFYRLGVRYMTLTWSHNNNWADASTDEPRHNGLTDFGREVVRRMNDLGMMVDISHVSDKTFYDVLEVSRVPVIATHSCCRALCDVPRNMTDAMIRALADHGGVMHINFHVGFLGSASVADHIDHVKKLVGVEHIGIGSDFDGARMPAGLESADKLPNLTAELLRRGYSEAELRQILGENTLRVMEVIQKQE